MATIYLGDRDEAYRRSLAHALRRSGDEVLEFSSGAELYARAVATPPDLVVLETELDELDGFQVFSKLHRERPNNPLPVVFVAEFEHPRVARVVKQRGALGYLGKGRDLENVVAAVRGFARGEGRDPLDGRTLSGAVAWLQSRGKSGRLEVDANGTSGYVILHHGRILEARWGALSGERAVSTIAENLDQARFRFAEGLDELEAPRATPAAGGEAWTTGAAPETYGPEDLRRAVAEALVEEGPDDFPRIDEVRTPAAEPATVVPDVAAAADASAAGGVSDVGHGDVADMVRRALEEPPSVEGASVPPGEEAPAVADGGVASGREKARRHERVREGRRKRVGRRDHAGTVAQAKAEATAGAADAETAEAVEIAEPEAAASAPSAPDRAEPAASAGLPAPADLAANAGVPAAAELAAGAGLPAAAERAAGAEPAPIEERVAPAQPVGAPMRSDLRRLPAPPDLRVPVPGEAAVPGSLEGEKRITAPAPSGSRRVPSRRPPQINPAVGGAVAAALELRLAWEQETEEARRHRTNRRRSLAAAAMVALLLGMGVAFAAMFPGSVPQALAGILGTLGIADERGADPITQMARAGEGELDDAFDRVDGSAGDAGGDAAGPGLGGGLAQPPLPSGDDDDAGAADQRPAAGPEPARVEPPPAADLSQVVESDAAAEQRRLQELAEQRRRDEALAERRARERALQRERELQRRRAAAAAAAERAAEEPPRQEAVVETPPAQTETAPPMDIARVDPEPQPARVDATDSDNDGVPEAPSPEPTRQAPRPGAPPPAEVDDEPAIVKPVLLSRGRDPFYPPELRTQNIGGNVLLNIRVGSNGRAQRVEVRRSSGYEALDQAAVAAVGTFLWDPARGTSGPTEAWVTQAVTFRP